MKSFTYYYRGFLAEFTIDLDGWYEAIATDIAHGTKDIVVCYGSNRLQCLMDLIETVNYHHEHKHDELSMDIQVN